MAVLKFDVYRKNEENTECYRTNVIEFDTDVESLVDQQRMINDVLELHKDKDVLVAPDGEESAWVLMKRKTGGNRTAVAPEVVEFVHERYVNHNEAFSTIPLKVYNEFRVEMTANIVKAILKQERDTDVSGFDDLREKAMTMAATGGTRRKYTDEDKVEWVRLHEEEGMSGSDIGKLKGINNATINAHLNKMGVQRNGRGRKKIEVAEQID